MLLDRPYVYDVVVSDFGRESTIEFLRSAAILEKRIVHTLLDEPNANFFDEYRRMMFVLLGDLRYFKTDLLDPYVARHQLLDSGVLVGITTELVPESVARRITTAVAEQLFCALRHGYTNLRVVIPCNTLAPLGPHLRDSLGGGPEGLHRLLLRELRLDPTLDPIVSRTLAASTVSIYTIPEIVLEEVLAVAPTAGPLLILGTPSAVALYRHQWLSLRPSQDRRVLDLSCDEQAVVSATVVASIDGDASVVRQLRQKLDLEIVETRRRESPGLVVVEACTDFDLGLGLSSRDIFVQRLVRDAYGLERGAF